MKPIALPFIFILIAVHACFAQQETVASPAKHPVYPVTYPDLEVLKKAVAPLMQQSVKAVMDQVPKASGIFYTGCPHCHGGAQNMNVLNWKPGMGAAVRCNYCSMTFPNSQFPDDHETVIIAPSGARQVYRYYEDSSGHQYYFEAHAWYDQWVWIRSMAEKLAQLWYATKDNAYGDRAAVITGRFAQVFPDYAVRYDYPHARVQFFPADQRWPYKGLTPYRGAKWYWWGYGDIATDLANVFDVLSSGYNWKRMDAFTGTGTDKRIARDLLRLGYDFTAANPEAYSNMSPGMYAGMIRVGRILGDPSMVHEAVKRFNAFFSKGFFADGWWKEGTTSYHNQTIGSLMAVAAALKEYTDPADWKEDRLNNPDLTKASPLYGKALRVRNEAVLPNGRALPINDTWGFSQGKKTDSTHSRLWPALGNAAIGTGSGINQVLLNLNWSGNYGHSHYDNGSILFYAAGQELLSDIGYTHSKYRGWTIHTASHNTVVIDQQNQNEGTTEHPATGRLLFYDDQNPHVKIADLDASPAYAAAAVYRRKLIMVHAGAGFDYVIDRFEVSGGQEHDWFLHGMCEQEGTLQTSVALEQPVETLVPAWGGRKAPKTQYDTHPKQFHAYAYLRDVKKGTAAPSWTATWNYDSAGLRTHILSQPGTEVFRFRSPSVRPAKEDDNKLNNYMRNGIMQRHSGSASVFIAVHEPFRKTPWIESVKAEGNTLIITYRLNGKRTLDRIHLGAAEIRVVSSAGWNYASGNAYRGTVQSVVHEGAQWSALLDRQVPAVDYIRLDLPDGGTYYGAVAAVRGNRVILKDDPGFALDEKGRVQFYTFPQKKQEGKLRYTLFTPDSK
ncbi:heparinase II/III-family protein [Niabella pedocola]|uniref:Heparinase II/III-family protein n=1 Tax=Niabella pedocola TaxID=1752077 RepID=A0ABS8PN71_9BACT|nr:heparinase II/III family protein [Niabella pedocola]MCD2422476.1 heparinase II/III-family protein [Niabella pedocola]